MPRTLHEALDDAAARWPDRPYVITDEVTYTYAQIREWSLRLGARRRSRGSGECRARRGR